MEITWPYPNLLFGTNDVTLRVTSNDGGRFTFQLDFPGFTHQAQEETITPNISNSITCRILKNDDFREQLSSMIKIIITRRKFRLEIPLSRYFRMRCFIDELKIIAQRVNILLYGPQGAGKTSFLLSCYKMIQREFNPDLSVSAISSSPEIVTREFKTWKLNDCLIYLTDMWGFNNESIPSDNLIDNIFQGRLGNETQWRQDGNYQYSEPNPNYRQHCAIFIISYEQLQVAKRGGTLNNIFNAYKYGKLFSPIIVVTCQNVVGGYNGNHIDLPKNLKIFRKELATRTGFPKRQFIFLRNYVYENNSKFKIDRCIFDILRITLKNYQIRFQSEEPPQNPPVVVQVVEENADEDEEEDGFDFN